MVPTAEIGYVQSIEQDDNGMLLAASDPRKMGGPAGF